MMGKNNKLGFVVGIRGVQNLLLMELVETLRERIHLMISYLWKRYLVGCNATLVC